VVTGEICYLSLGSRAVAGRGYGRDYQDMDLGYYFLTERDFLNKYYPVESLYTTRCNDLVAVYKSVMANGQ
jgi:hypothetical protein